MSREKILAEVKKNQPPKVEFTAIPMFPFSGDDLVSDFTGILEAIGGKVYFVKNSGEISDIINKQFQDSNWILSLSKEVLLEDLRPVSDLQGYEKLDLLVIDSDLAVAENGSIWITENEIKERVLPFITQHLAVIIKKENIVANMHQAYEMIGMKEYGFATFIAGPSKTADIEQSLVLGAHGPKTMTVFIL